MNEINLAPDARCLQINVSSSSPLDKYPAKQHGERVSAKLAVESGLVFLRGAPIVTYEDSDNPIPFRQHRYFFYLSGVEEAGCCVTYDISKDELTLWLPHIDARQAIWGGGGSTPAEALERYDIDSAKYSNQLGEYLAAWGKKHSGQIYVLHPSETLPETIDAPLNTNELQAAMDKCRVIKDDHEIKLIKSANQISTMAHEQVLRRLKGFRNEAQVEALFLDVSVAHGAKHQAYNIIAGSGPNAAVLHYGKNDEDFGDRQLMCLDAGAEWQCYASDVTRTFPLTGVWPSEEAKQIYNLVQKMQTKAIDTLGPGKRYVEAHYVAHMVLVEGLLDLGILHNGDTMEIYKAGTSLAFLPHGLGHHIGLEVHDVSPVSLSATSSEDRLHAKVAEHFPGVHSQRDLTAISSHLVESELCRSPCRLGSSALETNMIVTVEPGIYFNDYAFRNVYLPSPVHSRYINESVLRRFMDVGGVRIEDDILITSSGYQNITTTAKGERALRIIRGEE